MTTATRVMYRLSVTTATVDEAMHLGDYEQRDAAFAVADKLAEAAPELYGVGGKYRLNVTAVK